MDFWFWFVSFLALLLILFCADLVVVFLSYSMCWYEYANADPQLLKNRFRLGRLRRVCSAVVQEIFFNYLTLLSYPFGLLPSRSQPAGKHPPILLLHGLFNNQASWFWLKATLHRQGFGNVTSINLSAWHSEERLTELVAKKVDALRHRYRVDKVHLIGHSMGGLIARNYVQLRGGATKVDHCIFLGTPHLGSKLAPFALSPLGRGLIPGATFLQRLADAPSPAGIRFTNIYSRLDNMVLPNSNSRLPWAENIELDRLGHTALIFRKPALEAVVDALRNESEYEPRTERAEYLPDAAD